MQQVLRISAATAILLQTNSWIIVDELNSILGTYKSRDEARTAKKEGTLAGRIVKASEFEIEIVMPVPAPAEQPAGETEGPGQPMLPQPVNSGEIKIRRKTEITNVSTIERPCKKVWDIAENMPGAKRKDVLAACVEAGIAYYTARTQYQQWLGIRKEMAAEAAARAAKAAK